MLSLFYTLIKYEMNNELVIFWMNGITKLKLKFNFKNIIYLFYNSNIYLLH